MILIKNRNTYNLLITNATFNNRLIGFHWDDYYYERACWFNIIGSEDTVDAWRFGNELFGFLSSITTGPRRPEPTRELYIHLIGYRFLAVSNELFSTWSFTIYWFALLYSTITSILLINLRAIWRIFFTTATPSTQPNPHTNN
ncbi:hypothetical protein [Poriferisphaera sp. WC338]|uniref:hypothetical protein n=1 Tax=Poriferisphaera sp. WC338 TaxID=3425129 RepID=UPI003D8177D2